MNDNTKTVLTALGFGVLILLLLLVSSVSWPTLIWAPIAGAAISFVSNTIYRRRKSKAEHAGVRH